MKKQKINTFLALIVLCVAMASAGFYFLDPDIRSGVSGQPLAIDTYATDDSVSALTTSMNTFAFEMYKQLSLEVPRNIFFSPYSIFVALSMTYEGARNDTAWEMNNILTFPQNNETALCSFGKIYNLLNQDKEYTLNTANALWIQKNYPFLVEYLEFLEHYYMAQATNVNFTRADDAAQMINDWVEKNTRGKITDFLTSGDIDPLTKMILTNAIYFKGLWDTPFDSENTQDQDFKISPGTSVMVPMMHSSSEMTCNYTETDTLQILELPYQGNVLSMVIMLPKNNDLIAFEQIMTFQNFSEWQQSWMQRDVRVSFPKFKFEARYQLKNYLMDMGMVTPFTYAADFSGMTGSDELFIEKVIHQAVVEVTEEGSEAAAATSVHMVLKSVIDEVAFEANHPFVFLIQHRQTGAILFMGKVHNPLD